MVICLRYCDEVVGWDIFDDFYDYDEKNWEEKENCL